ncbi:hypothetical protein ACHAWO_007486 [Cyclotella atomus]|uniref:Uncharacterized protein n=1 Tax=Cyclotella atomus TaxID=382360 RepID=A0ABD3Q365_9STRA
MVTRNELTVKDSVGLTSFWRLPISVGIEPVKWLSDRFNTIRSEKYSKNSDGSGPARLFPASSIDTTASLLASLHPDMPNQLHSSAEVTQPSLLSH